MFEFDSPSNLLLAPGTPLPEALGGGTQPNGVKECVLENCSNAGKVCAERCGYNTSCYQECLGAALSNPDCLSCIQ